MTYKTTQYNPYWYILNGYTKETDEQVDWFENEKREWESQLWQGWSEKRWGMEMGLINRPVYREGQVDKDLLKERTDIVEVIGQIVKLRKAGSRWTGLCPFSTEKTPSFFVFKDHYHCFSCGAHGDVFDFIMRSQSVDFKGAIEFLNALI